MVELAYGRAFNEFCDLLRGKKGPVKKEPLNEPEEWDYRKQIYFGIYKDFKYNLNELGVKK